MLIFGIWTFLFVLFLHIANISLDGEFCDAWNKQGVSYKKNCRVKPSYSLNYGEQ